MSLALGSRGALVSALQTRLNELGSKLVVDGDFGAKTKTEVLTFQQAHGLVADGIVGPKTQAALDAATGTKPIELPTDGKLPTWLDLARSYIGEHELSPGDNQWIKDCFTFTSYGEAENDEVPWCAAFVCRVLAESGYATSHSALAYSYHSYGTPCEIKPGAIVVFKWASGGRHVSFIDHVVDGQYIACTGGNQSNACKTSIFDKKYVTDVRWPVK